MGFFGLTPQYKPHLHREIFQLVYRGQGFTHADVYEMPTYLRKFYTEELISSIKSENEEIKKASQKSQSTIPKTPSINPRLKR